MAWWLSTDQRLAERFVLDLAREHCGMKRTPTRIPDWLESQTDRYEVQEFIDRILSDEPFWVPDGLGFYGKATWEKLIQGVQSKGA